MKHVLSVLSLVLMLIENSEAMEVKGAEAESKRTLNVKANVFVPKISVQQLQIQATSVSISSEDIAISSAYSKGILQFSKTKVVFIPKTVERISVLQAVPHSSEPVKLFSREQSEKRDFMNALEHIQVLPWLYEYANKYRPSNETLLFRDILCSFVKENRASNENLTNFIDGFLKYPKSEQNLKDIVRHCFHVGHILPDSVLKFEDVLTKLTDFVLAQRNDINKRKNENSSKSNAYVRSGSCKYFSAFVDISESQEPNEFIEKMMMSVKNAGISEISARSGIYGLNKTNTIPLHIFTTLNIKFPTKLPAILFKTDPEHESVEIESVLKTEEATTCLRIERKIDILQSESDKIRKLTNSQNKSFPGVIAVAEADTKEHCCKILLKELFNESIKVDLLTEKYSVSVFPNKEDQDRKTLVFSSSKTDDKSDLSVMPTGSK